ncbi:MAG TPA: cyclic nucleotide-binding domain-containing protein, partial [Solirubrobacteraceae bacterium]|nr:cyclic nucleotide-binding domain-containing protein [Solirubrobacteraceae bacterium]
MTADSLRDLPVLASLADEELVRLAAAGRERRLAAGEFLFQQGDRATAFHLVLDGRLETTREVAGEQVLLMNHGPGGFLGAMALLTETPYRGSTFAVDDTLLFELDGEELRRLAFTHPSLLRQFL